MKKQLSTHPLRLLTPLKTAAAEISKADGTSINQFVTTAVAEKVSALRTAAFFSDRAARADVDAARRSAALSVFVELVFGLRAPPRCRRSNLELARARAT